MRDYTVVIKRTFVFGTVVESTSAINAAQGVIDTWIVPDGCGDNMREELQTMRRALKDETISPLFVLTEGVDVV